EIYLFCERSSGKRFTSGIMCNQQHRIETELVLCHKKIQAIMNGVAYLFQWLGMGTQELLDSFDSFEAVKSRNTFSPEGHRGMSVLIFDASAVGYLEADCASPYRFEENEAPGSRSFFTEIITSISDINPSDVLYFKYRGGVDSEGRPVDVNITTLIRIDDDGPDRSCSRVDGRQQIDQLAE
ncbi:suppressor of gene silencing 3-like protein, partial [Tanacetum coccineum]